MKKVKKNKFTFKTEKPTGRYKSFYPDTHLIKLNKKEVGMIDNNRAPFKLSFMVMKTDKITDSNKNCDWRWNTLSKEFTSLQEAKDWANEHIDSIMSQFTLHFLD